MADWISYVVFVLILTIVLVTLGQMKYSLAEVEFCEEHLDYVGYYTDACRTYNITPNCDIDYDFILNCSDVLK